MASREAKYPNTDSFYYYNANPKGRITGDCRIRALAVATEIPYNEIVRALADIHIETGWDQTAQDGINIYLNRIGWGKHKQPRHADNIKYTGTQLSDWLNREYPNGEIGGVVAKIGTHHMVAINRVKHWDGKMRYKVIDIWNSTNGCICNWWTADP